MENKIKRIITWTDFTLECECGKKYIVDKKKYRFPYDQPNKIVPIYTCSKCNNEYDEFYNEEYPKEKAIRNRWVFGLSFAGLILVIGILLYPSLKENYDLNNKWIKDKTEIKNELK